MADLAGGAGVAATTAAVPRPTAAPAPTSSPSGIRGPRVIMQERAAREARQRAEAERQRLEQARAQEEAILAEESRRRNPERRSAAAAAGQGNVADGRRTQQNPQQHQQRNTQHEPSQQHSPIEPDSTIPIRGSGNGQSQQQQQPSPPRQSHNPAHEPTPSQRYLAQGNAAQRPSGEQRRSDPAQAPPAAQESTKPRSSFPHAFERWETLSAHWEGLTSYWIRRLEQNKEDINRDPLNQQLARQVTDLSAAGANLFHAVVELQRLRASSERKFQRWFFETRTELERAQEVKAMLEAALDKERRERADAIRDALDQEQGVSKTQKQLAEMRKELAISKEEARRAWEELGRREQDERQRTLSLQAGAPTIVGGVQVVPMTQGHSRHQSTREQPSSHQAEYEQAQAQQQSHSPPGHGSPPTPDKRGYYQPQSQGESSRSAGNPAADAAEARYRENEYVRDPAGNYVLDVHGKRIPLEAPPSTYSGSEPEAEEYETPATTNPPSGGHDAPTPSAGPGPQGQWTGTYSDGQDYTGEGYGAPGWETVPRHHHPTRLSDVIEEDDERSRTSASQVSRGA